jgi:membrane protease YdiL (CAAX protease family)
MLRRLPPWAEIFLINLICFGPFMAMSAWEMMHRRDGHVATNREMLTVVAIELVCGVIAALILRARGWTWADFNLQPTFRQAMAGILLCYSANLLIVLIYATYTSVSGVDLSKVVPWHSTVTWPVLILLVLINPLYEELFEVAYNVRAAESHGGAFVVTLSSVVRFSCHLYQGPIAAITILPLGLIFAYVYWRWRKLWPLVIAHAAADAIGLWPEGK